MTKKISKTYPKLLERMKKLDLVVFDKVDYDLNIIGVRSKNAKVNKFNDKIHVIFKVGADWHHYQFNATTDPGLTHLRGAKSKGTAILKHNMQYRSCYSLGMHKRLYEALVQKNGVVTVWRDRNNDDLLDFGGKEHSGFYGINIHRASASKKVTEVNSWSAGCQVIQDPFDYEEFIRLCKQQVKKTGWKTFSYTLLYGVT